MPPTPTPCKPPETPAAPQISVMQTPNGWAAKKGVPMWQAAAAARLKHWPPQGAISEEAFDAGIAAVAGHSASRGPSTTDENPGESNG